jgi:hypothetical protein
MDAPRYKIDDSVTATNHARSELRPGEPASIVAITDNRTGKFLSLPKTVSYTIAFRDSTRAGAQEAELIPYPEAGNPMV